MTLDTLMISGVRVPSCASHLPSFSSLYDETTWPLGEEPTQERLALLQKLVDLSSSEDSLDWDALARLNIEGWGADADSE